MRGVKIDIEAARWWSRLDGNERRTAEAIASITPGLPEKIANAKASMKALENDEANRRWRENNAEEAARAVVRHKSARLGVAAELEARAAESADLLSAEQRLDVARVRVVTEARDRQVEALDHLLAGRSDGFTSIRHAYATVTATPSPDVDLREAFRELLKPPDRATESLAFPAGWSGVFGDSVTRRAIAEYAAAPSTLAVKAVTSSELVGLDFRTQRFERIGGYGLLPTVNQGAPYQPLTTPGTNEEATFAVTKKGGTEDYTLEAWLADDISPLRTAITKLSRAASQTLAHAVFDTFTTNPNTTYDATPIFAAGHGLNSATTALTAAALGAARKTMRKQAALNDPNDVLGVVPLYLFVSADLEDTAVALCTSVPMSATVSGQAGASNMGVQRPPEWDAEGSAVAPALRPVVVPHWSSTTQWVLAGDPTSVPILAIGYYGPSSTPQIVLGSSDLGGATFSADKLTLKLAHTWGFTVLDHRGLYRGNT